MVGDFRGQRWTAWFLWKKGITLSDIRHSLSAIYGEKSRPCSTVLAGYRSLTGAVKLNRWLSMTGIAASLKNGSMKPSRSSQGDGSDVQSRNRVFWINNCLVFRLKIIKFLQIIWVQTISKHLSYTPLSITVEVCNSILVRCNSRHDKISLTVLSCFLSNV